MFLPQGSAVASRAAYQSSPANAKAQAAERLEFGHLDYPAAIASYQQALDGAANVQTRAELAGAIARVQKKSARFTTPSSRIAESPGTSTRCGAPAACPSAGRAPGTRIPVRDDSRPCSFARGLYRGVRVARQRCLDARRGQYDFCAAQVGTASTESSHSRYRSRSSMLNVAGSRPLKDREQEQQAQRDGCCPSRLVRAEP